VAPTYPSPWENDSGDEWEAVLGNPPPIISVLLCPSDGFGGTHFDLDTRPTWEGDYHEYRNTPDLYKSNYLGIFSGANMKDVAYISPEGYPTPVPSTEVMRAYSPPGMFWKKSIFPLAVFDINRGAKIRQIADGTSHTLLMVEYLTGTTFDLRGYFWTTQAGASVIFAWNTPNSSSPDRLCGMCIDEVNLPEMNFPCVDVGRGAPYPRTATARSRHPGGVNVVLADGSVHFMEDLIDMNTWRAMGTIANGEVIQSQ